MVAYGPEFMKLSTSKGKTILDSELLNKPTWKGVLYGVKLLNKGIVWRVGKGDQVNFWQDICHTESPLIHHAEDRTRCDLDCVISSFYKNGWWDLKKLRSVLAEEIIQKIINTPMDSTGQLPDTQIWGPTSNSIFSVKCAYQLQFNGPDWPHSKWNFLWALKIPSKIHYFFWLVAQGKILSIEQRVRRHLTYDPSCGSCCWPIESVIHILRDCPKARAVWATVLPSSRVSPFLQMDFLAWLSMNLLSKQKWCSEEPWYMVFMFTCSFIWKWRNQRVLGAELEMPSNPKHVIFLAVYEWYSSVQSAIKPRIKTQIMIAWNPPETGQFKLNVDGTRKTASGAIGAGGLIRDSSGDWIRGFAVNLGKGQILDAEIWGLFCGLRLAVSMNINNLLIEMDSANAINLIQKPTLLDFHPLNALVRSCSELMKLIGSCSIHHIYREKNSAADALANWSYNLALGHCILDEAPSWLGNILLDDLLGIARPSIIHVT